MASRPGSTSPVEGNGFDRHLEAGHGNLNGASKEKGVHVADGVNGQDEEGKEYQVTFDHPASSPDIVNPYSIPKARKWLFVICTSLTSACVTCVSSLYTTTYEQLEKEWGVSEMVCTLGLSLFVAGLGLGPMLLAPLSEVSQSSGR